MSEDYEAPEVHFTELNDRFHIPRPDVRKISGTSIGALLGCSKYESPFTMSAKLHRLWNVDISDRPQIKAGRVLEERIIDYVSEKHPDVGQFFKAEELFEAREGDHDDWVSDFEDDDFNGHVDGIISRDGQDYILEVKTVGEHSLAKWENGDIPEYYKWQVYLYNHFITHQDTAYFAVGILDSDAYANPYGWVPNRQNCLLIQIPIDQEEVAKGIEKARSIRRWMIESGDTLPFDLTDPRDLAIWQHLHDISADVPLLYDLVDEYERVYDAIKEHDEEIAELREREANLKGRIKDIMLSRSLGKVAKWSLSVSERKTFDFAKAKADGLTETIEPYTKTTSVKTLRRTNE